MSEVSGAPTSRAMSTRHSATATTMDRVFTISRPMTAFTPPRTVYSHSSSITTSTVTQKGMPAGPATSSCSVAIIRNSRTAAPSILERKKNQAPVLWADTPKRCSRYWYTDTTLRRKYSGVSTKAITR